MISWAKPHEHQVVGIEYQTYAAARSSALKQGFIACCVVFLAISYARAYTSGPWDMEQWRQIPGFQWDNSTDTANGIHGVYFDGPPFNGTPSRIYAWYCHPRNMTGKLPAMVIVQGSGGGINEPWYGTLWSDQGFVALAVDAWGLAPTGALRADGITWQDKESGDNFCLGTLGDTASLRRNMWHQQVAAIIRGVSFLCAQPEVDTSRIGIAGGSFGGSRTMLVAGLDSRIKLALPLITAAYMRDTYFNCRSEMFDTTFDPKNYLPQAQCVFFWPIGTNDPYFYLDAWYKSTILPKTQTFLRIDNIDHWSEGAMMQQENFAIARHVFFGEAPVIRIMDQGIDSETAWAMYDSQTVNSATLWYSADGDDIPFKSKTWSTAAAQVDGANKRISAAVPAGATVCFFNTVDANNQRISSQLINISTSLPPLPAVGAARPAINKLSLASHIRTEIAVHGIYGFRNSRRFSGKPAETFDMHGRIISKTSVCNHGIIIQRAR